MNILDKVGFVAGFLTSVAFVPQVVKVFKDKHTEGISLLMYLTFMSGLICWIIYSIHIGDTPLLIANIVTLALAFPVFYMVIRNKMKSKRKLHLD